MIVLVIRENIEMKKMSIGSVLLPTQDYFVYITHDIYFDRF